MLLQGRDDTGAEEWSCPECGRRFLMRWPPHYEKIVLDPGDDNAVHVGGKGGVKVGSIKVEARPRSVSSTDTQWLSDNGIYWHTEG